MSVTSSSYCLFDNRTKPLTAEEYTDSLQDGRSVYIYGKKLIIL